MPALISTTPRPSHARISAYSSLRPIASACPDGGRALPMPPGSTFPRRRLRQVVEAGGVARQDLLLLFLGRAGEVLLDRVPGVGPVGADVRVVARPQHVVHTDGVAVLDGEVVGDVGVIEVGIEVGAGDAF